MDFLTLARERFTVRKYSSKKVEPEKLDLILKAGQLAPTAANRQPQRILVIKSEEAVEKLKECVRHHYDAPAAMLVCYDKDACWVRKWDEKASGEIDASIVTTHLMLEAADLGLGTTWVMGFDAEKTCEVYKVPENYVPVAFLLIGYPAEDAVPSERHLESLELSEFVFYDDFGAEN